MRTLTIETGAGKKGRSFTAALLAYATANALWDGPGGSENIRPAFLQVACSEAEARPVLANLQEGRRAWMKGEGCYSDGYALELLRSGGYVYRTQRLRAGVVVTAFLPELFTFDPGMVDPAGVGFVLMPPRGRLEVEAGRLSTPELSRHVDALLRDTMHREFRGWDKVTTTPLAEVLTAEQRAQLPAMAALFCASLDRRTALPILPDLRFQVQLYLAMLGAGLASWSVSQDRGAREEGFGRSKALGFYAWGEAPSGLASGVACRATHAQLEVLLAEQVTAFDKEMTTMARTRDRLATRRARGGATPQPPITGGR